jgi:hypothetical protein
MAAYDPVLEAHKRWLGYLQPVGLVVSPHALVAAQAIPTVQVHALQRRLQALLLAPPAPDHDAHFRPLADLATLLTEALDWRPSDLQTPPDALAVPLPEYGTTLRPTYAVRDPRGAADKPWLALVQTFPEGHDLDAPTPGDGWDASPQAQHERLLRELAIPIGLSCNGHALRLTYAPRGETSGHLTFPLEPLLHVDGRPMLSGLELLLSADRVFGESDDRRLPALLAASRRYQSEVSTRLAEQVLGALHELLRGFQTADPKGALLPSGSPEARRQLYGGLLTVLLRLVFLLYAEDRGLMPDSPTYANNYAVTGLYLRLREDAGRYADTLDQRFGAWPWLCALFRLVFTGGSHHPTHLPARHGRLFDPDAYPFLEGRPQAGAWQAGERVDPPRLSDGTVWRVLSSLLLLDGERLSYRSLDVEQIGSVYESIMGFDIEEAAGPSIAVRPAHVVVNLAALLHEKPSDRASRLEAEARCKLTAKQAEALRAAKTVEEALSALEAARKLSPQTPHVIAKGGLYLQPGEERRRSGSHYTPRALTGPIVAATLRPVLAQLGPNPRAQDLLQLKICDPAMGSGAFLVETCRQLAEELVRAWDRHKNTPDGQPPIPSDEDPLLHARRLVAERCLYGVDKNPFAVDLAKLSLWLVTLAKDHPFTFVDHALKHGDSLVGLSKAQIAEFRWDDQTRFEGPLFAATLHRVQAASALREELQSLGEGSELSKRERLRAANDTTEDLKLRGDAILYAFFKGGPKDKDRERKRAELATLADEAERSPHLHKKTLRSLSEELHNDPHHPISPFHWEIEFPEVFYKRSVRSRADGEQRSGGFDAFVGNPPFLGGMLITANDSSAYLDYLKLHFPSTGNRMDLCAYFFRRAYELLRKDGTLGMIATNTIAEGDTRSGGLTWIGNHGGIIYNATRRYKWPGTAAVVVSIIHIARDPHFVDLVELDGEQVSQISAFLFPGGSHNDPARLTENAQRCFVGNNILGMGFTFDDSTSEATPLSEMRRLIDRDQNNARIVHPFIGGEEINSTPDQSYHRYVIDFGDMSEKDAKRWPDLYRIVENKVRPSRVDKTGSYSTYWWRFGRRCAAGRELMVNLDRVLVNCQVSPHLSVAFQPTDRVFAHTLNIFAFDTYAAFALLQSRVHEVWARFFASSMKDDLRYTPSTCFETFPFPPGWESAATNGELERAGREYYEYRAGLMVRRGEGLTKTYNRFHDPDERDPEIERLRELHAAMDAAVLRAYGWHDLAAAATCEFLLDYEDDPQDPTEAAPTPSKKNRKKPYRLRWPDPLHDQTLARLLQQNQSQSQSPPQPPTTPTPKPKKTKKNTKKTPKSQPSLLPDDDDS